MTSKRFGLGLFLLLGACAQSPGTLSTERVVVGGKQLACYHKVYVPAIYKVNTEGRLYRPAKRLFEIVKVGDETRWNAVMEPPIYIETTRLLHRDHYTLHRVACES